MPNSRWKTVYARSYDFQLAAIWLRLIWKSEVFGKKWLANLIEQLEKCYRNTKFSNSAKKRGEIFIFNYPFFWILENLNIRIWYFLQIKLIHKEPSIAILFVLKKSTYSTSVGNNLLVKVKCFETINHFGLRLSSNIKVCIQYWEAHSKSKKRTHTSKLYHLKVLNFRNL